MLAEGGVTDPGYHNSDEPPADAGVRRLWVYLMQIQVRL
jgi:hypothetical protein